ncbi:MAG: protease modulator HflC [Planctomycetes bacterium]|nr:protease modulator HflC [Planctomycetota bacterium]
MKKILVTTMAGVVLIVLTRLSFFTVDAAEYVYVSVLGEHRATFDGSDNVNGAGLKLNWPWPIAQVQRHDRRLQQFDLPPTDQLTHDPEGNTVDKLLSIEAYVCWKISDKDGVDRFVKRIGSAERARSVLGPLVVSRLGAAIGQIRMDDLVTTAADPVSGAKKVDATVKAIRQQLLDQLQQEARDEYGIELVDIRLRRFNHPASVRDSIFQRIISERDKEAKKYKSQGDRKASDIAAEAEEEVRKMLAQAKAKEEEIKAQADIQAMKIRNAAYSQDKEFYTFLKNMEMMQSIVGDPRTVLLLSTHRPMFEALFAPPRSKSTPKK